jgi:hypothetical protein
LELTDSHEVHNERRMPNIDIDTRIRGMIESFAGQLAALIRESAMETVRDALGGGGRGKRSSSDRGVSAVSFGGARLKGQKRDPEELSKLRDRLLDFIKGNPGLRIEQIADGLKTSTRELNLPAKKLIAEKLVKTRGQKRATRYFSR